MTMLPLHERHRVVGEPLVWLTAMGLGIGLLMVIGLLGVITVHGVGAFWPRPVERLTLTDGSTVIGEIVDERSKHGDETSREFQIFTGNRDAFGSSFRFIDATAITARTLPTDVVALERVEYGTAIGTPVRIQRIHEPKIDASVPEFASVFAHLVEDAGERREAIATIERGSLGNNAKRISALELELKSLNDQGPDAVRIRADLTALRKDYDTLAAQARDLRIKQKDGTLILALADGSERRVPISAIIRVNHPNQMSWFGRLGECIARVGRFISENPRESNTEGGIFPAIFGTMAMTILMSVAVVPLGVVAAIYLREYAKQGPLVRTVRIAVNNLAGVPSIVFGVFGLGFFVYIVGGSIDHLLFADKLPTPTFGTGGIMWAALTMALMTVPVVIVATEESIAAVPRGAKEGALALGASKWQTIRTIVLPASVPGILTGLILAMARGAGEVAPLMLVGVVKLAPTLPINTDWPFVHLDQKFMHLGFHIYDLGFQSPDSDAAKPMVFATTLFLIALVLVLNLSAIILRERLRRRFATGAF
jgi:phosphate transport system permease protein